MPESDTFLANLGMLCLHLTNFNSGLLPLMFLCEHTYDGRVFMHADTSCICIVFDVPELSPADTTYPDEPKKYQILTSGSNFN